MQPLINEYVEMLDDDMLAENIFSDDGGFKPSYAFDLLTVQDKFCEDMMKVVGVTDEMDLQSVYVNKKNINKDRLYEWLETACCILNLFNAPEEDREARG